MAEIVRMPKMSDTMTTGTISSWAKKVGDKVEIGDVIAEVETDKATMDLESPEEGTLLFIGPKERDSIPINGILAVIGNEGEAFEEVLQEYNEKKETPIAEKTDVSPPPQPFVTETVDSDALVVTMPKMSDTMTTGKITSWLVEVGDEVASGDIMAEVETDKATMELESYQDGKILYRIDAGTEVEVDEVIAVVGKEGADYQKIIDQYKNIELTEQKEPQDSVRIPIGTPSEPKKYEEKSNEAVHIKSSPLAKKMAKEKGYDISKIKGTAHNGRIIKRDIENYQPTQSPIDSVEYRQQGYKDIEVSQMRKVIAKRLLESKNASPHFYMTSEIDMTDIIEARNKMNLFSDIKISFNDIIVKVVSIALRKHPQINSSWMGDKIRQYDHIHIGIAVGIEDGLLVPVIRFADEKSISQISDEAKKLIKKAQEKKLQPSEWEGNTFTISNLGMFDVDTFTAIINPPDAGILAVGRIKKKPIVKEDEIVLGNVMQITLSFDHRIIDGLMGATFLKTVKDILENPMRILL